MTDKQIIIDDVDVSKCAHYDKNADKEAPFLYDCKREHAPYWSCASMPNCLYKKYKRKEQECEEFRKANDEKNELLAKLGYPTIATAKRKVFCLQEQLDRLKAEVKSKTEYIQEQRDIINQYSKEIEMYKKCQGKRASKREEELKAENKHLNDLLNQALKELEELQEGLENG